MSPNHTIMTAASALALVGVWSNVGTAHENVELIGQAIRGPVKNYKDGVSVPNFR